MVIFQLINLKYIQYFWSEQWAAETDPAVIDELIEKNLSKFKKYALLGTITSFACLISVIGQFLFNAFSKHKLPFDKWALLELLNAITNSVVYNIFNRL